MYLPKKYWSIVKANTSSIKSNIKFGWEASSTGPRYGQVFASINQTRRSSSRMKSKPISSNLNPGLFLGSSYLMHETWVSIIMSFIL